MDYTALKQAIIDYTANEESTYIANIPVFVKQAEDRIYNNVQLATLRKNVTGTLTSANKYLSCPTDFLAVFSIAVIDALGGFSYLLNKDVNFIRECYPTPTDVGLPRFYALFGPTLGAPNELSFILGPAPDANYNVELHYFYYPESIVTAGTSWLGDNFDPVLLYGALREAAVFMKEEADIVAGYEAKFTEALAELKRLGDGLERGDAYRDGQAKVKVP